MTKLVVCLVSFGVLFSISGERAGARAANQRAAAGQPAAVHPADWHQGHGAARSTCRRQQR